MERIEQTRGFRLASKREATRNLAATASQFAFISHPNSSYLLIPSVSSERRTYIPMGFLSADVIASNLALIVPDATLYHFGVLSSSMHMAWVRQVCGRLEARYRYSNKLVYNNFVWVSAVSDSHRTGIERCAQDILDVRSRYPTATLGDLYDPNSMPTDLVRAHEALDRAVDRIYRREAFKSDRERVELLFSLYEGAVSPITAKARSRQRGR
jgi:hypothetical protein